MLPPPRINDEDGESISDAENMSDSSEHGDNEYEDPYRARILQAFHHTFSPLEEDPDHEDAHAGLQSHGILRQGSDDPPA